MDESSRVGFELVAEFSAFAGHGDILRLWGGSDSTKLRPVHGEGEGEGEEGEGDGDGEREGEVAGTEGEGDDGDQPEDGCGGCAADGGGALALVLLPLALRQRRRVLLPGLLCLFSLSAAAAGLPENTAPAPGERLVPLVPLPPGLSHVAANQTPLEIMAANHIVEINPPLHPPTVARATRQSSTSDVTIFSNVHSPWRVGADGAGPCIGAIVRGENGVVLTFHIPPNGPDPLASLKAAMPTACLVNPTAVLFNAESNDLASGRSIRRAVSFFQRAGIPINGYASSENLFVDERGLLSRKSPTGGQTQATKIPAKLRKLKGLVEILTIPVNLGVPAALQHDLDTYAPFSIDTTAACIDVRGTLESSGCDAQPGGERLANEQADLTGAIAGACAEFRERVVLDETASFTRRMDRGDRLLSCAGGTTRTDLGFGVALLAPAGHVPLGALGGSARTLDFGTVTADAGLTTVVGRVISGVTPAGGADVVWQRDAGLASTALTPADGTFTFGPSWATCTSTLDASRAGATARVDVKAVHNGVSSLGDLHLCGAEEVFCAVTNTCLDAGVPCEAGPEALYFVRTATNRQNAQLFTAGVDGAAPRRLLDLPLMETSSANPGASISSDGTNAVYQCAFDEGGCPGISDTYEDCACVVDLQSGVTTRIAKDLLDDDNGPRFTPSGTITLLRYKDPLRRYVVIEVDLDGNILHTFDAGDASDAVMSFDGTRLATLVNENVNGFGGRRLDIWDTTTGTIQSSLASEFLDGTGPHTMAWRHDGSGIAFSTFFDGLYLCDVDGFIASNLRRVSVETIPDSPPQFFTDFAYGPAFRRDDSAVAWSFRRLVSQTQQQFFFENTLQLGPIGAPSATVYDVDGVEEWGADFSTTPP